MKKNILHNLKTLFFVLIILSLMPSSFSQQNNLGQFDGQTDIGAVKHSGSVQYNPEDQTYTIEGSGTNMWFGHDEFHFLWKRLSGDFILRARVRFIGEGVELHRKIGWIVRNSLSDSSVHVNASLHGDGLMSLQYRTKPGADTEENTSDINHPDVIQLERQGDRFIMSVARYGETLTSDTIFNPAVSKDVFAGLYVCAHNPDVLEKAVFSNVRIILPADKDFTPYQDYIGSHVEIMNVQDGHRKILYSAPISLQAPNWTVDGKSLIYNSEGLLYNFDLKTLIPKAINTGFATHNNNDHVLSFDGKQLGISNHSEKDNNNSIIYTLPTEGGTPTRVTSKGPSYLHGWSPDAKWLIYTGQRDGQLDIYKISVKGGEEINLTNQKMLDDGSEYSPDGKYIYFNSARTGTMQIWRMKPDGSNPEQLTFDEYNDWFPHISPDGKWMVFISFPKDIDVQDHPFYKHVYIRMMPADGGTPKVIAYVYGGQGTMNVPSWSPDGSHIAFISNSKLP